MSTSITLEPALLSPTDLLEQIELLQKQLTDLHNEVNFLRRRDETLNFSIARFDEELRLAARLQQDFLPKSLPQVGRIHFHTLFRPAGYVSGDLYDVMRLDEHNVGFYMADAVGHGMPAALLTMFIKNALVTKQITPEGYRLLLPSETMSRLNESMIEQNLSAATFATAIYGTIDAETLTVSFARGGHPHPMLMRADGSVHAIEADGGLLGVFPRRTLRAEVPPTYRRRPPLHLLRRRRGRVQPGSEPRPRALAPGTAQPPCDDERATPA